MIIITGAAGFIGSCVVAKLNEMGHEDLILVDHILGPEDPKQANIANKKYRQFYDKSEFLKLVRANSSEIKATTIIHMGACSSTTLDDADYFKANNLEYSITVCQWAIKNHMRFIYASSAATYGDGSVGYKDDDETIRKCRPLNLYGKSKQDFDLWILKNGLKDKVVGLKFFNVFGPNEYHKGDMRSVVAKAYSKVVEEGQISLFKSYHKDYADGEQRRDFIYVKDVVDIVMFFFKHQDINGIFNVGTGESKSWNELAKALFAAVNKELNIKYIDMPESLRDKYQNFTEADMRQLRSKGYDRPMTDLNSAVSDYVSYLKDNRYW